MLDNIEKIIQLRKEFLEAYQNEEYHDAIFIGEEIIALYKNDEEYLMGTKEYTNDLNNLAIAYDYTKDYGNAKKFYKEVLEIMRKRGEELTLSYADTLNNLAIVYSQTHGEEDAIKLHLKTLYIRKKILPPDDADVIESLINVANAYEDLFLFNKSIEFLQKAVNVLIRKKGRKQDTVEIYISMAQIYRNTHQYLKCMEVLKEAREKALQFFGPNSIVYVQIIGQLAEVNRDIYNLHDAIGYYEEVLAGMEAILGQYNVEYIMVMNTMADIYSELQRFEKAYTLRETLYEIVKKYPGEDSSLHDDILTNLAFDKKHLGFDTEAEKMLNGIIQKREEQNSGGLLYCKALAGLAHFLYTNEHYQTAMEIYESILQIVNSKMGKVNHIYTDTLTSIAEIYIETKQYDKAFAYQNVVIKLLKGLHQEKEIEYFKNVLKLAEVYAYTEDMDSANQLMDKIMEFARTIQKAQPGEYYDIVSDIAYFYFSVQDYEKALHFYQTLEKNLLKSALDARYDLAFIYYHMANIYDETGRFEDAVRYNGKAIELRSTLLGQKNILYTESLNNMAIACCNAGDYEKAVYLHNMAIRLKKDIYGQFSEPVGESYNNLAIVYYDMDAPDDCLDQYFLAAEAFIKSEGAPGIAYGNVLNSIANIFYQQNNMEKASFYFEQALQFGQTDTGKFYTVMIDAYTGLGDLHYYGEDYAQAVQQYQLALEYLVLADERNIQLKAYVYKQLAQLYKLDGQWNKAANAQKNLLKVTKNIYGKKHLKYADEAANLADIYKRLENHQKALNLYKEAYRLKEDLQDKDERIIRCIRNIAGQYEVLKDYKNASCFYELLLTRVRNLYGENHRIYFEELGKLAYTYLKDGKYTLGINNLRKAVSLGKTLAFYSDAEYMEELRTIISCCGNNHTDIQIESIEELLRYGEDEVFYIDRYGTLLVEKNGVQNALEAFEQLYQKQYAKKEAYLGHICYWMEKLAYEAMQWERVVRYGEEAVKHESQKAEITAACYEWMAEGNFHTGQYAKAEKQFAEAARRYKALADTDKLAAIYFNYRGLLKAKRKYLSLIKLWRRQKKCRKAYE